MNLYFVIVVAGIVGGTVGPSPLTMDECNYFAAERKLEVEEIIETGINLKGEPVDAKTIEKLKEYDFICIETMERPVNGSPINY